MKTLILVRHAKAARNETAQADMERPLAERGTRDAPEMGKRLRTRGVQPDLMLSSPALRALETARLLAAPLDYTSGRIAVEQRLYPGEAPRVLEVIRGLDPGLKRVLLVGHNPGLSELAHRLTGERTDLPTCAVVELTFDADAWSKIGSAAPSRVRLDYPKK